MSFSVSCPCGLEYSGRRPFAQPRRSVDPRHLGLLWEIGRWLRTANRSLDQLRLRSVVARPVSRRAPVLAAVPAPLPRPADRGALVDGARPRARVSRRRPRSASSRITACSGSAVSAGAPSSGGNDAYVRKIGAGLGERLHLGAGVRSIRRGPDGVELTTDDGERRRFDAVVVATHADQALRLLEDPSPAEQRVLGAFDYTPQRDRPAHGRVAAACGAGRARLVELPPRRRREADGHVLPQPPAAARHGSGLVRDAERRDRRGARRRADHVRAPALHDRDHLGPARAAGALRARGGRGTRAPTTATASTRTGSRRAWRPRESLGVAW